MTPAVDCVLDIRAALGEGAIWSVREQALYWVDIVGGTLNRFDPASGANRHWDMGRPIGCFALKRTGGLVVALADGFHHFDPDGGALTAIHDPEPDKPGNRFNDGTVDHQGRFYAGTMPIAGPSAERGPEGTLYRLDADESVTTVRGDLFVVNGLAFSPDGRTAYLSDSYPERQTIWAHDYDPDTAAWTNARVFFDARAVDGRPDGGAVDAEGCYWMAGVGGWQLVRITPAGDVDMIIPMPVEKPTRIAFGGADLGTLYVTTIGSAGITRGSEDKQPQAGSLFALTVPGVKGVPMPDFDG